MSLPAQKKKKAVSLALKQTLKRAGFNPVQQLLFNVYPSLDPKDQKEVCLTLISYLYPKATPATRGRQARPVTTNIQVNAQGPQPTTTVETTVPAKKKNSADYSTDELLRLAKAKIPNPS